MFQNLLKKPSFDFFILTIETLVVNKPKNEVEAKVLE